MPGETYPKNKIKNAKNTARPGCPTKINSMTPHQAILGTLHTSGLCQTFPVQHTHLAQVCNLQRHTQRHFA